MINLLDLWTLLIIIYIGIILIGIVYISLILNDDWNKVFVFALFFLIMNIPIWFTNIIFDVIT